MNDLIVAIVSIIIGIVATLVVSNYYFKKSIDKSLTPFAYFRTSFFRGVSPEVRQDLKVEYKGVPVKDIEEFQFLIANTGERAIRDVIKPLSISIPKECFILDAAIIYKQPEERVISVDVNEQISINFPLLNRQEFFIIRLLISGRAKFKEFKFNISADDLPPVLDIRMMDPSNIISSDEKKSDFELGKYALTAGTCGLALPILVYTVWKSPATTYQKFPEWLKIFVPISMLVAAVLSLFLIIVALIFFSEMFTKSPLLKKSRFRLPSSLIKNEHAFYFDRRESQAQK